MTGLHPAAVARGHRQIVLSSHNPAGNPGYAGDSDRLLRSRSLGGSSRSDPCARCAGSLVRRACRVRRRPGFAGCTPAQILALVTDELASRHPCLFIVDKATASAGDWPVLVMDLRGEKGRMFRVTADEVGGIEANLSVRNIDFSFYADFASEAGGVFRGGPAGGGAAAAGGTGPGGRVAG